MTDAGPYEVHEVSVPMDYGQFGLWGSCVGPDDDVDVDSLEMTMLTTAQEQGGIAGNRYGVLVLSPHQNNFDLALRVELWRTRPPDDADAWEEVAESGLTVAGGVLRYESPTMRQAEFAVPDGHYAVRICGRGFVSRGWPGSTTPGDVWRVQLWPSTADLPDRRIRSWDGGRPATP